jgi:hypothetical protein
VVPSGKYLLYLSTPATGSSAQDDLEKAVAQLVQLPKLLSESAESAASTEEARSAGTEGKSISAPPASATALDSGKPQALQVFYYRQHFNSASAHVAGSSSDRDGTPGDAVLSSLPPASIPNLVLCPGPSSHLVGYGDIVGHAKFLLAAHFPGVPWLLDTQPEEGAPGSGDMAGGDADADEAVLDLQAALAGLQGLTAGVTGAEERVTAQ